MLGSDAPRVNRNMERVRGRANEIVTLYEDADRHDRWREDAADGEGGLFSNKGTRNCCLGGKNKRIEVGTHF